jgi:2-oxoglutarate ferredoxin oxidoreductase subunit alpha
MSQSVAVTTNTTAKQDISIALTGSGGAGVVAAGELLLNLAAEFGYYGLMRRAYGPQIRGGESAALLRLSTRPVHCMDDSFGLLLALDWQNTERFAAEIPLNPHSLIIADPAAGEVPAVISQSGAAVESVPLKAMAKDTPTGRANMVAMGLLARWLGFDHGAAHRLIAAAFGDKGDAVVESSLASFDCGFNTLLQQAPAHGLVPDGNQASPRWQLNGNEGCGLGALRGGIRFAAAYPITPASDMLEWLAPRLEQLGGSLLQAEDELASINMIIGASYGGVPAMTATSGPGLALMLEGLGLAIASETPVVVVNVMRGGPSTGIPTKSEQSDLNIALYGMHGDAPHLVMAALDTADCVFCTEWAVRLAEALQSTAIVLSDQSLAQSRALIPQPAAIELQIPPRKQACDDAPYLRYAITEDGVSPMAIPGMAKLMYTADGLEHTESGKPSSAAADHRAQLDKRQNKLCDYDYGAHWAETSGDGDIAIITWGSSTGAAREAQQRLAQDGHAVRLIALRLLLPARPRHLAQQLQSVQRVLIVEQSHSRQFYRYLRAYYDIDASIDTLAKPGPLSINPGEIVDRIVRGIRTYESARNTND